MIKQEKKSIDNHKVFACLGIKYNNIQEQGNGNFAVKAFCLMDKTFFDGRLTPNGFNPVNTDHTEEDFYFFGTWGSLESLCLVNYSGGDLEILICSSEEEYKRELQNFH